MVKLTNDSFGNPRFYVGAHEMTEKQIEALRERFAVRKYTGKKYGAGFAITAYLDASQLLDFIKQFN